MPLRNNIDPTINELEASGVRMFEVGLRPLKPVPAEKVAKFWADHKDAIIEILGSEEAEQFSSKFWSIYQLEALKILGAEKVNLAIKFGFVAQVQALRILGAEKANLALKFILSESITVLEILGSENADKASAFEWYSSRVKALQILGAEGADIALRNLWSDNQLRALEIVGPQNVEMVLRHSPYEEDLQIYRELVPDKIDLADAFIRAAHSVFEHRSPVRALWIVGKEKAELALKVTDQESLSRLLSQEMQDPAKAEAICAKFEQAKAEGLQNSLIGENYWKQSPIIGELEEYCRHTVSDQ